MRKGLILCLTLGLVCGLSALVLADADIATSYHDFTGTGGGSILDATQICQSCHVPHTTLARTGGAWSPDKAVLWSPGLDIDALTYWPTADYWYTQWGDASYSPQATSQLDGSTRRCMSCHDGSVWIAISNAWTTKTIATGRTKLDNLASVHPVAIDYKNVAEPLTDQFYSMNTAIGNGVRFYMDDADKGRKVLSGEAEGWMGCGSCHDPHDTDLGKFIRVSLDGSELCLACHAK